MVPLIIDCDPGQDDAVALLLAMASPEELQLLGITTVAGNVSLDKTSRNARQICELAGQPQMGVYAGCPRPLLRPLETAEQVHGKTGIDGADLPEPQMPLGSQHAVPYLIETLMAAPEPVTLALLGPMTNLAVALVQQPRIVERIQYAIRKYKAKRVSIDSVTAIFQQYDPAGVVRRELFRLTARLKQANVTTVMTTERTDEYGPIARYGVEEFVSDNVVILRNILEGEKRRRTIEILKLRGTTHMKGEYPFTITNDGINIFPLGAMQLTQRSSNVRVSSGIEKLDEMCGGGFFKDSIILATGATGTGKTSLVSKFLERGCLDGERCILFAYEESRAQLSRNASSWGIDLEEFERQGLLKIICAYPESAGLEDHLQKIKTEMMAFKPSRMAIDSLSALARGVSQNAFRQFVIGVTGLAKQEEITGFFTNTTDQFMGSHSITESHISTITDTIILLQYVEIRGEMARALNVFKMRGSWHDKGIREYLISNAGIQIRDSFRGYERIISGSPTRINVDEKNELSRIVQNVQALEEEGL